MALFRSLLLAIAALAIAVPPAAHAAATPARHGHHRVQKGMASYYHPSLAGRRTASGKPLKTNAMTAASKTLPLGAKAKVTNAETGKSVEVTVTDRGPFAKGRILDVTPKAAEALGMKDDGVAPVKVEPVAEPVTSGDAEKK